MTARNVIRREYNDGEVCEISQDPTYPGSIRFTQNTMIRELTLQEVFKRCMK